MAEEKAEEKRTGFDLEVSVMRKVHNLLAKLDVHSRRRVITFLITADYNTPQDIGIVEPPENQETFPFDGGEKP